MLKQTVHSLLTFFAKKRLAASKAKIIGITGSIGKTSTKEAVFCFLQKSNYRTFRSIGNFNTEFGLPLSILEIDKLPREKIGWIKVLARAFFNSYLKKFKYDFIVLEYGVDKPGDMDDLVKIVKPDIVIITQIAAVHMDKNQFKSIRGIWNEKLKLIHALKKDDGSKGNGLAIMNFDDELQKAFCNNFEGVEIIKYGANASADIRAVQIKDSKMGLNLKVKIRKKDYEVNMKNVLGIHHAGIAMVLFALADHLKIDTINIIKCLQEFNLPVGRMNIILGIKDSIIIDSSYNASPVTMKAALETLSHFKGRRIAALGQMNELGDRAETEHIKIGKQIVHSADVLITVGKLGRIYAKTAADYRKSKGLDIYSFDSSKEAGNALRDLLKNGDTILVKGSQNNVRMENLIKEIMKEPEKAEKLLVRQGKNWIE
ncbi:hypothetical protein KKG71_04130 [Patescibacteria group bacterium]|nr:hypothetical protein [Patescibacteria group bacterium]